MIRYKGIAPASFHKSVEHLGLVAIEPHPRVHVIQSYSHIIDLWAFQDVSQRSSESQSRVLRVVEINPETHHQERTIVPLYPL